MYAYSEHKQVSALRFAFKFPLALALDDVGLADSSNHAPERAFEQALTGVGNGTGLPAAIEILTVPGPWGVPTHQSHGYVHQGYAFLAWDSGSHYNPPI